MKIKSVEFRPAVEADWEAIATMEDNSLAFVYSWFSDELILTERELVGKTIQEARDLKQEQFIVSLRP